MCLNAHKNWSFSFDNLLTLAFFLSTLSFVLSWKLIDLNKKINVHPWGVQTGIAKNLRRILTREVDSRQVGMEEFNENTTKNFWKALPEIDSYLFHTKLIPMDESGSELTSRKKLHLNNFQDFFLDIE